ncbi:hypothetical protein [Bradyrhizobium japonicum]|uniref:hypothetical protein n=1 Tax=Bradyrhizobium japonicum TaxID=375 RepID=UPI000AA3E174|nr:hypothetical protein [Bradyrhizobium japonicum]
MFVDGRLSPVIAPSFKTRRTARRVTLPEVRCSPIYEVAEAFRWPKVPERKLSVKGSLLVGAVRQAFVNAKRPQRRTTAASRVKMKT